MPTCCLQPTSDGLQPTRDGLQPTTDALQPTSDGVQTNSHRPAFSFAWLGDQGCPLFRGNVRSSMGSSRERTSWQLSRFVFFGQQRSTDISYTVTNCGNVANCRTNAVAIGDMSDIVPHYLGLSVLSQCRCFSCFMVDEQLWSGYV